MAKTETHKIFPRVSKSNLYPGYRIVLRSANNSRSPSQCIRLTDEDGEKVVFGTRERAEEYIEKHLKEKPII